ncbi:P-loop containing nucleoside triphosphate hydrolase protein [Fennellomyces sp. T-0311]|nr:P-loop containing nucleoside triphosphate hydrolase protein [Fennellomyces sp. T-0311]
MAPLKIIGAGMGRTGTDSLRIALNTLGYNTHHMKTLNEEGGRAEMFTKAYEHPEEAVDWDYIYEGFDAAIDWPTCAFVEPLMKKYPDAKVILTIRDPDSWYRSMGNTIFRKHEDLKIIPETPRKRMARRIILDGAYHVPGMFEDQEAMKEKFIQNTEWVKKHVPEDRLLIMELGEGWERLCKFLDKPVPDVKYPHVNTTADNHRYTSQVAKQIREAQEAATASAV